MLGFLIGLVTLGILITPIVTSFVVLIMMKRGGKRRAIAKSAEIIVIIGVLLILLAGLFPPYRESRLDAEGNLIGTHTKWEFNKHLEDLIESITQGYPVEMIEYTRRNDILGIEIIGILALAGSAYLISKKRWRS